MGSPEAAELRTEAVILRSDLAAALSEAGDYRRSHGEAEQAQGAARRLKELVGIRRGAA